MVKTLLGAGADPNARDEFGSTPLHEAVLHGNEVLVHTLLEAGSNPDLLDNDGHEMLLYALEHGQESITQRLHARAGSIRPLLNHDTIFWTVPIAQSHLFVDRPDLMEALETCLMGASDEAKRVVIAGMGGIG